MAVLLVLGFIDWIQKPGYGIADMAWLFARELGIGLAVGLALGAAAVWTFRRLNLATSGLYPVASIAAAALAYGGAAVLHGSGFLSVYLAGLALGTAHIPAKRTITAFHEGLAWVAQIALFLTLGLLVFPSQLGDVLLEGTLVALVVVLVARPLATVLATAFERYTNRERLRPRLGGPPRSGPGGARDLPRDQRDPAQPGVLQHRLLRGGDLHPRSRGPRSSPSPQALGTTSAEPALPRPLAETGTIRAPRAPRWSSTRSASATRSPARRVRELGLPREALVNVIVRGDEAIPPARLDADRGRRPPPRAGSPGGGPGVRGPDRALAKRARGDRPRGRGRAYPGHPPVFSVRPWSAADGDPARPKAVAGRWWSSTCEAATTSPGSVVALDDGRYAAPARS